ncbi:hypothetical protein PM10SUCC1_26440 [Propionigenium maris DSM 9537]|uniref:Beta-lactamase-related domain-containing protein n=1 Tax=Propionigenium maris DSM 9537 TaxID=1123000 RepID=A0A9W6GN25_9FUSO|nr:serine hydrolase [Propionigenium maris]GLI57130.1 hypothetical protein PM10SUCC1_26440 [Propionigenium maris DSM 9537]
MKERKFKSNRIGRIDKKMILIIIGVVLILSILFYKKIIRVYRVVTLFNSDKIVDNFRNMDRYFDTSTVYRGQSIHRFEYDLIELPDTYRYLGEIRSVNGFLKDTQTTGLIVIKDGKITFEKNYNGNSADTKVISWSVVKSIISALIGIAVEEGYIKDISEPVTKYVPSLHGSGYEGVSIKDVLQMSSGIDFNEDYGDFFQISTV